MADPWQARPEDYYDLLGISRHSRDFAEVLEGAYNRLIRKYHPDRAAEADKQRFTEESAKLNVAYQVLKDPETRRRYDDWLDHEGGYETVHGPAASSQGHSHASGSAGGTAGGQSSASPPPPQLAADPASLDFDTVPAGQPARITLSIRNVGGPCSDDLFRIRDPRHPAHPNHDPNHWLTISAPQPFASPTQGPIAVQCEAHTARLVPGRTYTADVYIDYCGDSYRLPVKITAPALKNHPYKVPVLAIGGIVGLFILVALVKSVFAGSSPSPSTVSSQPVSAVQPVSAAPPSPPPTAPPTPSPVPTPSPAPTPPPDTPAGSVLGVGDTWRQGGIALTLTRADLNTQGIAMHFSLVNNKPQQISVAFDLFEVVSVTDNRNTRFQLHSSGGAEDCSGGWSAILKPGDKADLPNPENSYCNTLGGRGDVTAPAVTAITIRVSGISSIDGAVWSVPVYH